MNRENEIENCFDVLLNEAKALMQSGGQKLGKLAQTQESLRNVEVYPTAKLQALQRLSVRNSLNIVKLKMNQAKVDEFVLVIDRENSLPECPALDLRPKPVRK